MLSPWISLVPLLVFILAALAGMALRSRLREKHKTEETTNLLRATITMLVTFAALVLGLLINSAKHSFDDANEAVHQFASAIVELNGALGTAGKPADPIRQQLIAYTAAMIASTWTTETPPAGDYYPKQVDSNENGIIMESAQLGAILTSIHHAILGLPTATEAQLEVQQDSLRLMDNVWQRRWDLITVSDVSFSTPFLLMLTFWLAIVFLSLGLTTPFNALSALAIALSAIAIASALFVIVDLSALYDGLFTISSTPMRGVLTQMLR
jgi:hypothetical protein